MIKFKSPTSKRYDYFAGINGESGVNMYYKWGKEIHCKWKPEPFI